MVGTTRKPRLHFGPTRQPVVSTAPSRPLRPVSHSIRFPALRRLFGESKAADASIASAGGIFADAGRHGGETNITILDCTCAAQLPPANSGLALVVSSAAQHFPDIRGFQTLTEPTHHLLVLNAARFTWVCEDLSIDAEWGPFGRTVTLGPRWLGHDAGTSTDPRLPVTEGFARVSISSLTGTYRILGQHIAITRLTHLHTTQIRQAPKSINASTSSTLGQANTSPFFLCRPLNGSTVRTARTIPPTHAPQPTGPDANAGFGPYGKAFFENISARSFRPTRGG